MQNIEAIIFDLGGVLLDIDYNLTRKAFGKLGIDHFNEMYSQAAANTLFKSLEKGTIREGNFYREFNECTGLKLSPVEINSAWNAMLLNFREESLVFLDEIKSKYKLFLLSNTNEIHYAMFREIYCSKPRPGAFEMFFEKAYYSFEIGMRKPDAECYKYVLAENNLKSRKTLFIDDSVQNVEGAKNVGIKTVLLKPGMSIEKLGL